MDRCLINQSLHPRLHLYDNASYIIGWTFEISNLDLIRDMADIVKLQDLFLVQRAKNKFQVSSPEIDWVSI